MHQQFSLSKYPVGAPDRRLQDDVTVTLGRRVAWRFELLSHSVNVLVLPLSQSFCGSFSWRSYPLSA